MPFIIGDATSPPNAISLGEAILLAVPIALTVPFQGDGAGMLLGLLILGFGLWQAFKMNARKPLNVSGPHALGEPAQQS